MPGSLYIHIPFCRRKCAYCNFYSEPYDAGTASSYIDVVSAQAAALDGQFSTIYIGGGTPSVLDRPLLEKLFKALKNRIAPGCEFTIEVNPESADACKLELFLDSGVNRISIGTQSFDERKLMKLGRIHDAGKARRSIESALKKGFKNISADLMFGVSEESGENWSKDLDRMSGLSITHISCYELTYEKGTPVFAALENRSFTPVLEEELAIMYGSAIDILSVRGFKQYEISNFAKPGFECRHNMNYWRNDPYTGLGASAFSYIDGVRSRNISNLSKFITLALSVGFPESASSSRLRFQESRPLI